MFPNTAHLTVTYRIVRDPDPYRPVRLNFREKAPRTYSRLRPYLYAANYSVRTVDEACQLLRNYLHTNGVIAVDQLKFPRYGKIRLTPASSWCGVHALVEVDGEPEPADRLAS